jgi:formate dehydrogenase iron-sulfur subunit
MTVTHTQPRGSHRAASDPARASGWEQAPSRKGFFTDTSVCIGCKACEVACKEWNAIPQDGPLSLSGMSFDNTRHLGASTWRHVAFVEQPKPFAGPANGGRTNLTHGDVDVLALASNGHTGPDGASAHGPSAHGPSTVGAGPDFRWLMASDVCKHCTEAACLDVCPTGALFRTEFGTVVVQQDICNGCGYCVSACPFGVIARREDDGHAWKCTLCYDRIGDGQMPACAKACPTESIQYGDLDELRDRARARVATLHDQGVADARLYGEDDGDGVGGFGAFFLLLDAPEVYGLPPDPVVTTRDLPSMWKHAAVAAAGLLGALAASFLGRGEKGRLSR